MVHSINDTVEQIESLELNYSKSTDRHQSIDKEKKSIVVTIRENIKFRT